MASTIQIKRGTGSAVPSGLADGELAINLTDGKLYFGSGSVSVNDFRFTNITAENYIVSSSVMYITTSFASGSNEFGNSSDDQHSFNGAITASGNISASGTITANSIVGTVGTAAQTNITSVGTLGSLTVTGNITANGNIVGDNNTSVTGLKDVTLSRDLTVGRNISASGHITASGILTTGNASVGTLFAARIFPNSPSGPFIDQAGNDISVSTGLLVTTNITASGNISASGAIYSNNFLSENGNMIIGHHSVDGLQIRTNDATPIVFKTNGNNIRATIAADGETTFAGVLNSTKLNTGQGDNELYAMNQDVETSDSVTFAGLTLNPTGEGQVSIISSQAVDLKIATTHASSNRDVGIELSGSGAQYSLALDRANDSFVIAPSDVGSAPNNAVFELDATGNMTASGNISASGAIIAASSNITDYGDINADTIRLTSTTDASATSTGHAFQAGATNSTNVIIDNNEIMARNNGVISALHLNPDGGNVSFNVSTDDNVRIGSGHITASGNISASGTIIGGALQFTGTDTSEDATHYLEFKKPGNTVSNITNGVTINPSSDTLVLGGITTIAGQAGTITGLTNLVTTNITASGNISASGDVIANTGSFNHLIMDDGIFQANVIIAEDTDESPSATIALRDADGNNIAQFARLGSGGNAHIGQLLLKDNANTKVNLRASGDSYFNGSSVQVGIGNDSPGKELDVTGEIRASGNITANGNIIGDNATNISGINHITASGNISSSGDINSSRYLANEQLALNNVNGAITLGYDNTYPINIGKSTNPIGIYGNITSSGNISSSGNNYASAYYTDNYVSLNTNGTQGRVFSDASITGIQIGRNGSPDKNIELLGPVTASGHISSSGTITADKVVSDNIQAGWHGSTTRIKILVSDFIPDDIGRPAMIDDTGSDRWLESHGTGKLFASVPIPTGFTATHVHVYGSATSAITVYEADINSKTVTSKGTGNIGTEIDITDVASDTTNYLFLELAQASGEEVYGGYVTITPS